MATKTIAYQTIKDFYQAHLAAFAQMSTEMQSDERVQQEKKRLEMIYEDAKWLNSRIQQDGATEKDEQQMSQYLNDIQTINFTFSQAPVPPTQANAVDEEEIIDLTDNTNDSKDEDNYLNEIEGEFMQWYTVRHKMPKLLDGYMTARTKKLNETFLQLNNESHKIQEDTQLSLFEKEERLKPIIAKMSSIRADLAVDLKEALPVHAKIKPIITNSRYAYQTGINALEKLKALGASVDASRLLTAMQTAEEIYAASTDQSEEETIHLLNTQHAAIAAISASLTAQLNSVQPTVDQAQNLFKRIDQAHTQAVTSLQHLQATTESPSVETLKQTADSLSRDMSQAREIMQHGMLTGINELEKIHSNMQDNASKLKNNSEKLHHLQQQRSQVVTNPSVHTVTDNLHGAHSVFSKNEFKTQSLQQNERSIDLKTIKKSIVTAIKTRQENGFNLLRGDMTTSLYRSITNPVNSNQTDAAFITHILKELQPFSKWEKEIFLRTSAKIKIDGQEYPVPKGVKEIWDQLHDITEKNSQGEYVLDEKKIMNRPDEGSAEAEQAHIELHH